MSKLSTWLFGRQYTDRNSRFEVRDSPILPTPDTGPVRASLPPEPGADALQPLKNWSHPFKDTRNPLQQLTHLAKATAGYYPLGRNGLWHGGVHFDSGTAGGLDQSSVQCLADGEVVAFRIDTHSPTTRYFINTITVEKPFSRNFVLVRHRLQPPNIEGSPDTPPSLTFYSLYMHLQDWAVYQEDSAIARPAFWPEAPTRRVKESANDVRPGNLEQRGLNVRNKDSQGKVIDLLPRGAEVTVIGEGKYRKLENTLGPANLLNTDGSLRGYVSNSLLIPVAGDEYRIATVHDSFDIRAEPSFHSDIIGELPTGTHVTVSGEGQYRKLERINQYVHFDWLQGEQKPLAADRVVVLETPVAIKAGALIGHLGLYQDGSADQPEEKLHLEVFSGDDIDLFIEASRAWAQRLPDKDKTWLKLAQGTAVVTHQENATAAQLKILSAASPLSAADLLVPKSLLDGLPADRKIAVPATADRRACNWYRLDGLLHDADNTLLDGWVREEVGVTPWLSPWSWEGYDVIFDYSTPKHAMASFLSAVDHFSEAQRERYRPLADKDDQGPMKSRLYDIIDRNRDGKMTAEELQAVLHLPAHAQSISQLIIYKESEWFHQAQKWDALDELLGHSGSTPHLNWLAEKQRIEQLSWWGEVAEKVGLPSWGKAYHFHPVGLVGSFSAENDDNDLKWLKVPYGQLTFDVEGNDIEDESHPLYRYFSRVVHWPGGASGITIGRGYDLGQRPAPESDLRAAGVEEQLLTWLIGAKGL
ncbi:hypothetical protein [Pseudomonas fluorescens]|uniref:EF-hand domain-containing protein n=1 Tax=Pseudomonas fluorescens TaxID=294 RepID=A0A5E7FBZ7_PSEFL|nr:hypothetical protein [Pseudomonas fluorescens]VVO35587.1 hypothetical protein PS723_05343 [Pseudomonas fluorescens]